MAKDHVEVQFNPDLHHSVGVSRRNGGATGSSGAVRGPGRPLLFTGLAIQALSALFFVGELWSEILGLRTSSLPWIVHETIQILATIGLVIGVTTTIIFLRFTHQRVSSLNRQVDIAAGNFQDHLLEKFDEWGLSPSEQEVAIFAMKGFSNGEVANLRGTSLSTVKSQLNAIYRKTGFGNRQQLIAFLVEEMLSGLSTAPAVTARVSSRATSHTT